jgi:predicted nucleic-acid-binding protein
VIAVDTSVLARAIVDDDPVQGAAARRWLSAHADEGIVVDVIVLCDLVWVLQARYRRSRDEIALVLERLLDTAGLTVLDDGAARLALRAYRRGRGDFADHLIAARTRAAGAERVGTFDAALSPREGFVRVR